MKRFRIKPENDREEYFNVLIYDEKVDMIEKVATIMGKPMKCDGITCKYKKYILDGGKMVLTPDIGTILFHREWFGPGVVAHEMTHATKFYFEKRKQKIDLKDKKIDERFAWIVGNMVYQFWKKYEKTGGEYANKINYGWRNYR